LTKNAPTAPSSPTLAPINDPTLAQDTFLQSMGLLDTDSSDFNFDAWSLNEGNLSELGHYHYAGDGMFSGNPASIDWSSLLSGGATNEW
jgi:hypothetical protein